MTLADWVLEPSGEELYATNVYSDAAEVAPARQTSAAVVVTEPTATVLGVTMSMHGDSSAPITRTPTVSERPPALIRIVALAPPRSDVTTPWGSTLTSVGSLMPKVSGASVTAFANSSART